jgi:(S)-ureidoglycine aminohydrolase
MSQGSVPYFTPDPSSVHYFAPDPTNPSRTRMNISTSVFGEGYLLIPGSTMVDSVASSFPYWEKTKAWVLTSPDMSHETNFCYNLLHCEQGGGSKEPEPEPGVEDLVFVLAGHFRLKVGAETHDLAEGGFAYLPPDSGWSILNPSPELLKFLWIRKMYEPIRDLKPKILIGNERELTEPRVTRHEMGWSVKLIPLDDLAYDMHLNINGFKPGAFIAYRETHVHQHGMYILQGQGLYLLNEVWYEFREGDYIWLHAWCPQACCCIGAEPMRYLLFKNVNRQFSFHR